MQSSTRFTLLAFLTLLSARVASAAPLITSGGDLTGCVTDNSGHALPGAEIRLINPKTGAVLTTRASHDGRYRFANVDTSVLYTLSVRQTGFAPQARTQIQAMPKITTGWVFTLRPIALRLTPAPTIP